MPPLTGTQPLEHLIAEEHQRLVGALALYVGDVGVAEELAQEALVRLCVNWRKVQVMESPRGWLFTVAFNLARSRWRRLAAERRTQSRAGRQPVAAPEEDHADVEAVRAAVRSLPPRQRLVVILRFYDGLSVAESAAVMGCAEGAVKSLTHLAVETLRTRFGFEAADLDSDPSREPPVNEVPQTFDSSQPTSHHEENEHV